MKCYFLYTFRYVEYFKFIAANQAIILLIHYFRIERYNYQKQLQVSLHLQSSTWTQKTSFYRPIETNTRFLYANFLESSHLYRNVPLSVPSLLTTSQGKTDVTSVGAKRGTSALRNIPFHVRGDTPDLSLHLILSNLCETWCFFRFVCFVVVASIIASLTIFWTVLFLLVHCWFGENPCF